MPFLRPPTPPIRLGTLALLLTAAAAVGCVRDPDPFTVETDQLAVHLVLVSGSDSVLAMIEYPGNPAEDADVQLIRDADTTSLHFSESACGEGFGAPATMGCFRALLPEPVQPGATYDLEIRTSDGELVTGRTAVPLPLSVTSPDPGARVEVHCDGPDTCHAGHLDQPPFFIPVAEIAVRWAEPASSDRLFGYVRHVRTFLDGETYEEENGCRLGYLGGYAFAGNQNTTAAEDSMVVAVPNIQCPGPLSPGRFDSIHAEIRLHHWDPAYSAYLEALAESGNSVRDASYGLDGAWGVFGASALTTVPVTLVRSPPASP